MERLGIFLAAANVCAGLDVAQMDSQLRVYWNAQTAGDAEAFLSSLAPGFTTSINGEKDDAMWNDFERVSSEMQQQTQLVLTGEANTVMVLTTWTANFKESKESLDLGIWNQKFTFTEEGKISSVSMIGDGALVAQLDEMLGPSQYEHKATVEKLLAAYKANDAKAILSFYAPKATISRNGQPAAIDWVGADFTNHLTTNCKTSVKLLGFASVTPRTNHAHLEWTITCGEKNPNVFNDAWFITWNTEGKISKVSSSSDFESLTIALMGTSYISPDMMKTINDPEFLARLPPELRERVLASQKAEL